MGETFEEFRQRRANGNELILNTKNKVISRFLALDSATYRDGALPGGIKELLGLVSSMVLRCNDCIDYHLERCVSAGYSMEELEEAMSVAMMVGGSIVIPHMRHAHESLAFLFQEQNG